MTGIVQSILEWFPFGSWLGGSSYGIVYGTLVINALSCGILLLSKCIFGEYFSSPVRMTLVSAGMGGTGLATVICYLYALLTMDSYLSTPYGDAPDFTNLTSVSCSLTLIAYLFFVGYLIDFILCLLRRPHWRQSGKGA